MLKNYLQKTLNKCVIASRAITTKNKPTIQEPGQVLKREDGINENPESSRFS